MTTEQNLRSQGEERNGDGPAGDGQRKGAFISGGNFHGQVIGYQENNGVQAPEPQAARTQSAAQQRQAEVLLITVTEEETDAVFDALRQHSSTQPRERFLGDKTYYDLGVVGGARVWLVQSEMSAVTPGGAFATVYTAIPVVRPAAILMVGIAFGVNPAKQPIGDVLVAKQIYCYEPRRFNTGVSGELVEVTRGDLTTASVRALDRCRSAKRSWPGQVQFGLMLSGDKLLDHAPTVAAFLQEKPEAIGGEMEGTSLYVAATQHKIDWLLLKGVCDWADGHKAQNKAQNQALAAKNAAEFALHMLSRGGFAPDTWGS